jgi:dolichol kinase
MTNASLQRNIDESGRSPRAGWRIPQSIPETVGGASPSHPAGMFLTFGDIAAQLGSNEFRRRLWHFAPGFLAIIGAAVPSPGPYITLTVVLAVSGLVTALACSCQRMFQRSREQNCRAAIVGYAVAVVPLFLIFPTHPESAFAAAVIMGFGDGSATLVGLLAGERKLPWNRKKSWAGSAAFLLTALPLATCTYWLGSTPHVSSELALLCVGPAVLGSAVVESLPLRGNDNLWVGPSVAAILVVTQAIFVGWP